MISRTSRRFRELFDALPDEVQRRARRAYHRFIDDPNYPSLHFKLVDAQRSLYSVRINRDYRALGVRDNDRILWIWIGSHDEYEELLG
jgi:hypothetical protein